MAGKKVYETQFLLGAKVQSSVGKGFGQVQKGIRGIQQQAAMSQKAVSGMSVSLKGLLGIAAGYFSFNSIKNFAQEGLDLASDLVEVQNVVKTTFKESTGQVNRWSKGALKAYGLDVLQAKQYSGTMGAMLKSSGIAIDKLAVMSTTMAGLAGDFASFYNLDHDKAFEKIRSGISGETEPLKQLGINMSVANLEAFAMSQGIRKAWAKMSQSEQVMLRYNYLLKVSKDAQGDFAKTNKEYANQQRMMQTNIAQSSATIMAKFLPSINKVFIKVNDMFAGGLPEKIVATIGTTINLIQKAAPIIEAVTIAIIANKVATLVWIGVQKGALIIQALSKAWGTATAVMALMREGYSLATIAQMQLNVAMAANPVGMIIAGLTVLIGVIMLVIKNWSKLTGLFKKKPKNPGPSISTPPEIKKYAGGTNNHPGGWAITGERGRELVKLPRGSQVTPNNRTEQLLNGLSGKGGGISLTMQQNFYGPADKETVIEANRESFSEFERKMNAVAEKRRRLNFA